MQIQDANKLMIKTTPRRIVNLQFFTNVMNQYIKMIVNRSMKNLNTNIFYFLFQVIMTTYNIISVLLKSRHK